MVCTDAGVVMMVCRDNGLYSCKSVKMTVDQDVAVITQGN